MTSSKKESQHQVNKMTKIIQQFDPTKIGVSNIIKSLILQIKYHKLNANKIKIFK